MRLTNVPQTKGMNILRVTQSHLLAAAGIDMQDAYSTEVKMWSVNVLVQTFLIMYVSGI